MISIKNIKSYLIKAAYVVAILIALLILLVLFFNIFFCLGTISPQDRTRTTMSTTFDRINMYYKTHHEIPLALDVLPVKEGYENKITDAWDRTLIIEITNDKIITLKSFGEDGVPGGDGDDADLSRSYWLRKPDGSLWIGDEDWAPRAWIYELSPEITKHKRK